MVDWLPSQQTSNTTNSSPTDILASQSSTDINKKILSTQSSTAVAGIITKSGNSNKIYTSDITGINGSVSTNNKLTLENTFGSISSNSGANQLKSAIQSITGTFSKVSDGLASGINKALSDIFKDTNIKNASTVQTKISDPVKTNLLDTTSPLSTAFKISSLESGSLSSTNSSLNSAFGSKSGEMIGTELSTLLNRFNLDSSDNVISKITTSLQKSSINGLFSNTSNITKDLSNLSNSFNTVKSSVLNSSSTLVNSVNNELQSFIGRTNSLSNLTNMDMSQFFVADINSSLSNSDGIITTTRGSGVDANIANDLLAIAKNISCNVPTDFYDSLTQIDSLFRSLLALATNFKLDDLLDSLLGCDRVNSLTGQESLVYVFKEFATTDLISADKILNTIENKSLLSEDKIYKDLVTNPSLKISDVGTMNSIITNLGSTIQDSYTIPGISEDVNVYDINSIYKSNSGFVNTSFGDISLTTISSGIAMSLDSSGFFSV